MQVPYLKIVLIGVSALLVIFITGIFTLGKERSHKLPYTGFVTLFENKKYETLISKIDSRKLVILEGNDGDAVDIFVAYVLNQTLPENHTVNERILTNENPDIEDVTYPLFSNIYNYFSERVDPKHASEFWVIKSAENLKEQHMNALNEFVEKHPDDKMIVITPKSELKSKTFKILQYPRPSNQSISKLLITKGLNQEQIKLVLKNQDSNLKLLQKSYDQETLLVHQEAFESQKNTIKKELNQSSPKTQKRIHQLCKEGQYIVKTNKLSLNKSIAEMDKLQSVQYKDGYYYWKSQNYFFAFESVTGIDCKYPEVFIERKYVNPQAQTSQQEVKDQVDEEKQSDAETNSQNQGKQQQQIKESQRRSNKAKGKKNKKTEKQNETPTRSQKKQRSVKEIKKGKRQQIQKRSPVLKQSKIQISKKLNKQPQIKIKVSEAKKNHKKQIVENDKRKDVSLNKKSSKSLKVTISEKDKKK